MPASIWPVVGFAWVEGCKVGVGVITVGLNGELGVCGS